MPNAREVVRAMSYALQHRGQESAGIAVSDGDRLDCRTGMGLVKQALNDPVLSTMICGHAAIAHNRYSTQGTSNIHNAQPMWFGSGRFGQLAVAHNGNLVNASSLLAEMERNGDYYTMSPSNSDTALLLHLIGRSRASTLDAALKESLNRVEGAYSLLLLTPTRLIAVRDPLGIRPLVLGRLNDGWVVASETCAFEWLGAKYLREVAPGEMVSIDDTGCHSDPNFLPPSPQLARCIFEYIYLGGPGSILYGRAISKVRMASGQRLAHHVAHLIGDSTSKPSVVIGVPESGVDGAIGFSEATGIPFRRGLVRDRYSGKRTFIDPVQEVRVKDVARKFIADSGVLEGRRVFMVDDSIVRGNTTAFTVQLIRQAGAAEVHVLIASPPLKRPCFYGVNIATQEELVAAHRTVEQTRELINADSLTYLTTGDLIRAADGKASSYCTACFTGIYPIGFPEGDPRIELVRELTLSQA